VLGPEADADVVPPPAVFSGAAVDPEKTAAVRTLAVTGPGLDDLLTTSLTRDSRQEVRYVPYTDRITSTVGCIADDARLPTSKIA
jgi:hypothetical protein